MLSPQYNPSKIAPEPFIGLRAVSLRRRSENKRMLEKVIY